jgi:SAM-dependent methyltransferase
MEWIDAIGSARSSPQRILVAGCGTGNEAFALRERFSEAEILAIDFSPRTIAIARNAQKRVRKYRDIRFTVGDLTHGSSLAGTGHFDFVTCHGVLSYLPKPHRLLRTLTRHLAAEGVLYLGVNGSAHFSSAWRDVLPEFDFAIDRLPRANFRLYIGLLETLSGMPAGTISRKDASYLASDVFGSLICNRTLPEWIAIGAKADLHFHGSYSAQRNLWPAINDNSVQLFRPRTRGEVAAIVDRVRPSFFHQLIFARYPEARAPWDNPERLLAWRPVLASHLADQPWPAARGPKSAMQKVAIELPATKTRIDLDVPEWEVGILRDAKGARSLREILRCKTAPASLSERLYTLYQLGVLNLLPPGPRAGVS